MEAAPCGHEPDDAAAIAAVRGDIERTCECAAAATHGGYVSCARTVALAAIGARTLRPQCLKGVLHCAARSTCGRPGAVACCLAHGNETTCRRSSSAARCIDRGGCPSAFPSCCDACGPGGCATTSTSSTTTSSSTVVEATSTTTLPCAGGCETTSTTTTTTGAPTTTLCAPVCGNGVCEIGEEPLTCSDCVGLGVAIPVLPATIGACLLEPYMQTGDCAALPRLIQIPGEDACFSSLSSSPSNDANILSVLPTTCCAGTTCGGGTTPAIGIGDTIDTNNGVSATVLQVLTGCFDEPIVEFLVPVTPCGSCGQAATVVGFAHVVLDHVQSTGVASAKGAYVQPICRCGDGVCSTDETCRNCRADCGPCPPVCE